jgi:flagellar protein FlaG
MSDTSITSLYGVNTAVGSTRTSTQPDKPQEQKAAVSEPVSTPLFDQGGDQVEVTQDSSLAETATVRQSAGVAVNIETKSQVSDKVKKMVGQLVNRTTQVQFDIDDDTNDVIVRVVSRASGEVIRQLPPEELETLRAQLAEFKGVVLNEMT